MRGDSRTQGFRLPADTYETGASVFFAMKAQIDDDQWDADAAVIKTLGDADIVDQADTTIVRYLLKILPDDTDLVTPGIYLAEFQYVSPDKLTVLTWPNRKVMQWTIEIVGDVNRRIEPQPS